MLRDSEVEYPCSLNKQIYLSHTGTSTETMYLGTILVPGSYVWFSGCDAMNKSDLFQSKRHITTYRIGGHEFIIDV